MTTVETDLLNALEATQKAYLALAYERAKQGDVYSVARAVTRSNEAGRRLEKMMHNRWVS